jgi:hypothetical protein
MLFALAVAEVAVRWAQVAAKFGLSSGAWPAHLHLVLAICIIATSWIGWSWSMAAGNIKPIQHAFSIEFCVLLVDVTLVILYFMIARSVEFVEVDSGASAREETFLVSTIFGIYFLWDFLTKALFKSDQPNESSARAFWLRGRVSFSCFLISLVGVWLISDVKSPLGVCMADISLIALVFLFRALKRGRQYLTASVVCAVALVGCAILALVWQ